MGQEKTKRITIRKEASAGKNPMGLAAFCMSHTCTITLTIVVHNKKTTRKEHNENKNKKHHLLLFYRKNDVIVNRSFLFVN